MSEVIENKPETVPAEAPKETPTEAKPTPAEEIVYDLKLSEKSHLKSEDVASAVEFAKANKLSLDQAKAVLSSQEGLYSTFLDRQQSHLKGVHEQWLKDVEADPEIGGTKLKESAENAAYAFKHFGSEKLGEVLEKSSIGNHPEMIRFAAKIGALLKNDRSEHSNTTVTEEKSLADIIYGGTK